MLPNTLLVVKIDNLAILIDPPTLSLRNRVGGAEYELPYYGYSLKINVTQWRNIENNIRIIVKTLGNRASLAILQ